jgi:hypothetical protein
VLLVPAFALSEAEAQKGPSCPLSDSQTRKSIDAFAKLAAFITHEPRCVNCHGGVNPYMDGTGLDPDNPAAAPSTVEHAPGKQFHENKGLIDIECTKQCHSAMLPKADGSKSRWFLPAEFHSFVDKDATTLCKQFKQSTGSAKGFIAHLTDDSGGDNFIGTAFNGDRGLSQEARDDYHVVVQKPTFQGKEFTKPEFVKLGQDWIDAMGGSFKGDPSCGCEFKHSKWSGQIHYVLDSKGDERETDLETWSSRELMSVTVTVSDGVGTAHGHAEKSHLDKLLQKGKVSSSHSEDGKADGTSPAKVEVTINEAAGIYEILATWSERAFAGNLHNKTCILEKCNSWDLPYSAAPNMGDLRPDGKLKDPNHVSGSKRDIRTNLGATRKGVLIRSVTWDLSRTDSSN